MEEVQTFKVSVSVTDDDVENFRRRKKSLESGSTQETNHNNEKQLLSVNYNRGMRRGSIVIPADKRDFARANWKPKTDESSGLSSLLEFVPEVDESRIPSSRSRQSSARYNIGNSLSVEVDQGSVLKKGRRRRRSISKRGSDAKEEFELEKEASRKSNELTAEARKERARALKRKFRVYSKLVIFLYRLCKHYQSVEGSTGMLWGEQIDLDDVSKDLLFDVTYFRVGNRQSLVSSECSRILSMPPSLRTDKDKYHVLIALRNYPSFTEYPLGMQQEIVGVGWYAAFGSKRVILRQGHLPLNYYFILSGSVVITVLDQGSGVSRTVVYLTRGEAFGELGLVNRQRRQSTVIAREKVELLCISDKDYTRIFMAGGLQTLMNPNQSDFVRNLSFLEGWPMHLLKQSHKKCVFSYFKKGDVLIRDSNTSDWIVIIKSGSCFVMKVLRRMKEDNKEDVDITKRAYMRKKRRNSQKRNSETLIENFEQRKKREEFELFMKNLSLRENEGGDEKLDDITEEDANSKDRKENDRKTKKGSKERRRRSNSNDGKRKRKPSETIALDPPDYLVFQDEDENSSGVADGVNPIAGNAFWELEKASAAKNNPLTQKPTGKKKTIMDDIVVDSYQEEDLKEPIWVSIKTLTRGSVFGLAELVFDSQPSFTVVSNGAECILLSKKFYLENATDRVMNRLRRDAQRFPGNDDLQVGLETKIEWDSFKVNHIDDVLEDKAKIKALRSLHYF